MALTTIISARKTAITLGDAPETELSGPVTIVAGKLGPDESIVTYIKTLDGDFETIQPPIVLSNLKNTDVIYGSGTFKFVKSVSVRDASLGYE